MPSKERESRGKSNRDAICPVRWRTVAMSQRVPALRDGVAPSQAMRLPARSLAADQYEKIKKFISTTKSEGATVYVEHLDKGYLIEPTIIRDVTTSMLIWREEVFGPVLYVKLFSTEDEVELANDTQYLNINGERKPQLELVSDKLKGRTWRPARIDL